MHSFRELVQVMHRLRQECPWDQEQTLDSLKPYLIEETYELLEALYEKPSKGSESVIEELGDVLLQVLFQSEILSEELKRPVIEDVISKLKDKLVRRHPHVFERDSNQKKPSTDKIIEDWNAIKQSEKASRPKKEGVWEKALRPGAPAMHRALHIGKHSQKIGFDWKTSEEVWKQVMCELKELSEAPSQESKAEELGDVLFSIVQWARHCKIDPDLALSEANSKFCKRMSYMIAQCDNREELFASKSDEEKEDLWKLAKANT